MNDKPERSVEELMHEFADEMGYDLKDKSLKRRRTLSEGALRSKGLMLGGVVVLLLIILIVVVFRGRTERSPGDVVSTQARLSQLEQRITHLEAMEDKIIFLEKQEKGLQQALAEANQSRRSLKEQLETLTQRSGSLKKDPASRSAKAKTPSGIQSKPAGKAKEKYHVVRRGDTLFRISRKYGISMDELCRLNNITPKRIIKTGQKLLVAEGKTQ